ncbi:FAD-binding oxidoreductase [Streptosporangiaceae bacterium NEAU-GS5]|nr:FAD-binding oxidoreductase [Streptosporangiaceae bacterium NEAU-GS5]
MNITALRQTISGAVRLPGEPGYDEQRQALNPAVDAHPVAIVEAACPADVRAAVATAAEHGLPVAVQATGHGTHVPSDGALLVRTTAMAAVLVDPDRRIAKVGPGARWGQVLAAAAPSGLAPLSGSSPAVGVTGYTLGGGLGWLARRHGFAADHVTRAEIVTAEGRQLTVGPDQHPDLFWAIRGGGGNFGVVTSLEFRLHPVSQVYAGITYFEYSDDAVAAYRDWTATIPETTSTALMLTAIPDGPFQGRRVVGVKVMHQGDAEEAGRILRPLRAALGPVVEDRTQVIAYRDAAMGGTPARHLDLFETLPDAVVAPLAEAGRTATVEIRHWGGAIARGQAPVSHRATEFTVIVDAQVPGVAEALRPHASGGSFLNFLADPARTTSAYATGDLRRLADIKRTYDPANVFRVGHAIAPTRPADVRRAEGM